MGGIGGGSSHGGGTKVMTRFPSTEKDTISNWEQFMQQQFGGFMQNYPTINAANVSALQNWEGLPGLTDPLMRQYQNLPSIAPTVNRLQNQFGNLPSQLQQSYGQIPSNLMHFSNQLGNQFSGLPGQIMGLTSPLQQTAKGYLSGVIGSQGALSPEASRDVAQQTRELASQYGTGRQLGTLGTELLNRQATREARYNTALGQYNAATGQIGALDQLAQGLGTSLAGTRAGLLTGAGQFGENLAQTRQGLGTGLAGFLQQLQQGDINQRLGLAGGIQGLQSGNLNQLLGVGQGSSNIFSQLSNPVLSYLGSLYGGNQAASIAQAGINQQGNIAGSQKTGGLLGGGISAIGSIIAIAL